MLYKTILEKLKRNWLYAGFFLLILLFVIVARFNGLYGQDSYEYLRFTNALTTFLKHGINPGKNYWPILYTGIGAVLSYVFKPVFALQLISIVSLIGAAVYLQKILTLLYRPCKESVRAFVFLFFLLSPYPLRASMVVMSDSLCLFFLVAAYYYYFKYRDGRSQNSFIGFVIFATVAISTRYAAFILVIIPTICAGYYFLKNFNIKTFLFSLFAALLILLPYLLVYTNVSADLFHHGWLKNWSIQNFFHSEFNTPDGNEKYPFPNILYSFFNLVHPAYCFAGVILLVAGFRTILSANKVLTAGVLLYALFIAGFGFQNMRFLLLSFPLVLIILFPGFKKLYDYFTKYKMSFRIILFALCTCIQVGLLVRVFIPFYEDNKVEKQVAAEILKYPKATIYTFSIDGALRAYGANNEIINLYRVRLDTLAPIPGEKLALFNESQFAEEWKYKNPMINWALIKQKYKLEKIITLPAGWELYTMQ